MIPKNITTESLSGQYAKLLAPYRTDNATYEKLVIREDSISGGLDIIPAGTFVIIRPGAGKRSRQFVGVRTAPCPDCGQYSLISTVDRDDLGLVDDLPAMPPKPSGGYRVKSDAKDRELVGKRCRVEHDIENYGGQGITPWTIGTIKSERGGLAFVAGPCPVCGRKTLIRKIRRDEVIVMDG